jgi:hypothetical protein
MASGEGARFMSEERAVALKSVIKDLQLAFAGEEFIDQALCLAYSKLKKIEGFVPYEINKYPNLVDTESYDNHLDNTPMSLAEAFIWKQGDWLKYRSFASHYQLHSQEPKSGHVHFAFAKHLREPKNTPIFDQNSLRAMWAICPVLTVEELRSIEGYLVSSIRKTKGRWKKTPGGRHAGPSMHAFFRVMRITASKSKINDFSSIDRLLMPLGSLLKTVKPLAGRTEVETFKLLRDCDSKFE